MRQQKLKEIARQSGRSISTVSKVLRGCPGVDAYTRQVILNSYLSMGEEFPSAKKSDKSIYVVLPDNPKYFWQKAYNVVTDRSDELPISLKICSQINGDASEQLIANYIEEAETTEASAIILSACINEQLQAKLAELAKERLVLQLCEYTPIPNTFYIGSNPYADGATLARSILSNTDKHITVGVLHHNESYTCSQRIDGFLSQLENKVTVCRIDSPEPGEVYSARLARAIVETGMSLDYLFSPDGITSAVCEALHKLRQQMNTRLIGFEYSPAAEKHLMTGRIAALALQNPASQMRHALSLANRYIEYGHFPDQKFSYLPSDFL